jgi:hypothetical protein
LTGREGRGIYRTGEESGIEKNAGAGPGIFLVEIRADKIIHTHSSALNWRIVS